MVMKARILVSDCCRGAAVASVRALARDGYEVIAADSDKRSPGLASRFAKHSVVYACPKADPQQFIEDILAAVVRYKVDMILPITEQAVLPLEAARERVEKFCKVPWPPQDAMQIVRDKHMTFQLAERLGIAYPKTRLVRTVAEALEHGPELGWPLVLKPSSSHTMSDSRPVEVWSVDYAHDVDELRQKMRHFEGRCPVLLQEYFQGAGVGVEVLTHNGRPICAFQHRRLREVPLTGGASSLRRSDRLNPNLYSQTLDLMKALNWTGLAMVEFKLNDQGESRLMEINGRVWGSLPVAIASGVNFPSRLCELTLNGPPSESQFGATDFRVGVHVQNFQKELSWMIRVLRGSPAHPLMRLPGRMSAFGAMLDLLKPHYRFDILALNDPMPAMRIATNLGRAAVNRAAARFPRFRSRSNRSPTIAAPHSAAPATTEESAFSRGAQERC